MITPDQYLQIQALRSCGFSYDKIAQRTGLSENTVMKYEKEGYKPAATTRNKKSKLDPFKDQIRKWMEQCPDYSSVQIEKKLRELNYDGGNTTIKDFLRKIRPKAQKAFLKLNFVPGDSAQVDWGEAGKIRIGDKQRKVYFFVMVMSHSRAIYVRFTLSMSQEFWLECHRFGFEYFGAVPRRVLVDNCKTAVLENKRGLEPVINPKFLDFADHYGFKITACNVRQPQEKGRVENGVAYTRNSFIIGRNLEPFEALNLDIKTWLDETANQRKHGSTGKIPAEELKLERPLMLPLNTPYDCSALHRLKVSKVCRLRFDSNNYSVPAEYVGEVVHLKSSSEKVMIYHNEKLIAQHTRSFKRGDDVEDPKHAIDLIADRQKAEHDKLRALFIKIDPIAVEFYTVLKSKRLAPLKDLRRLMALHEIHGEDELIIALKAAVNFGTYSCHYIENILEGRRRKSPEPGVLNVVHKIDMLELDIEAPNLETYATFGES